MWVNLKLPVHYAAYDLQRVGVKLVTTTQIPFVYEKKW